MPLAPLSLACNKNLNRLVNTPRGLIVKMATDLVDVPWIREAFWRAAEQDVAVLGRFDLVGPDRQTPWPSVLVSIRRRPRHAGQADRTALVAVYLNEAGAWEVSVRESGKPPWAQYRGSREGQPSVLNGDRPGDAPTTET